MPLRVYHKWQNRCTTTIILASRNASLPLLFKKLSHISHVTVFHHDRALIGQIGTLIRLEELDLFWGKPLGLSWRKDLLKISDKTWALEPVLTYPQGQINITLKGYGSHCFPFCLEAWLCSMSGKVLITKNLSSTCVPILPASTRGSQLMACIKAPLEPKGLNEV